MRAAIVGSGVAGLATSIRLAHQGYEVIVYEANSYPGGKLTAFGLQGFRFDAGPSLLTMPYLIDELIRSVGKEPSDYIRYDALNITCEYFYADGTQLTAYADKERFFREVKEKLGADTEKLAAYLRKAAFTFNSSGKIFLEKSLHKLSTFLSGDVLHALANMYRYDLFRSMHQANAHILGNDKLVQLFDRFATYNGSNPYQAPGIMNSIAHLEFNQGIYYPQGGMHEITLALYRLAQDLGVQFRFEEKVEEITIEKGRVKGLRTVRGGYTADLVISNMDIVPTYRHLLKGQKQPERILKQERSSSALIFYWGMNRTFEKLNLHNIFFSADYKNEFVHIFDHKDVYSDPTVYVNITSKMTPSDAPNGCENWFVMVNVPSDQGQDWDTIITKTRVAVIAKLNRMLGIKDLGSHIFVEEILDPVTIEKKTVSHQGALYGASSNNRYAAFLRHPNFHRKIEGLYFCGGSVHPGGGVPLCLLSSKIVSEMVPELPN